MNSQIIMEYLANHLCMRKSKETDDIDKAILELVKLQGKKPLKDARDGLARQQTVRRMINNIEFMIKNL